ncbi:MAG: TetR/AcrR family transcriptional regulator [Formosimonas sp.]
MTHPISIREHLLNVGYELMAVRGFSAIGLTEILTTAHVPKGSFYHHFKSKELFGQALIEHSFNLYFAHIDALFQQSTENAAQRMLTYWQQWAEHQCDEEHGNRCLTVKLTAEVVDLSENMRLALQTGTSQLLKRYAALIHEGIADGSMSPSDTPEQTALALYELWLGASLLTKIRRNTSALDTALHTTRQLLAIFKIPMNPKKEFE